MANEIKLSIVILNFNTRDLLRNCLDSLEKVRNEVPFEIIVIDNGSTDGSVEKIQKLKIIQNDSNLGFARGNNMARKVVKGKYVLFLNSDTVVYKGTLKESLRFMEGNPDVGAMTCKLVLANGGIDKDTRRRFPTPLISFKRLILGDGRQYWYEDIPENQIHEVDVLQGAYFLTRKKILDEVNWFDEDYFLDGEDIDLCWRIKEKGWKIIYFPKVSILHIKKATKKKVKNKYIGQGVEAMEIFYKKRMWDRYPFFINWLVLAGIQFLKLVRKFK